MHRYVRVNKVLKNKKGIQKGSLILKCKPFDIANKIRKFKFLLPESTKKNLRFLRMLCLKSLSEAVLCTKCCKQ